VPGHRRGETESRVVLAGLPCRADDAFYAGRSCLFSRGNVGVGVHSGISSKSLRTHFTNRPLRCVKVRGDLSSSRMDFCEFWRPRGRSSSSILLSRQGAGFSGFVAQLERLLECGRGHSSGACYRRPASTPQDAAPQRAKFPNSYSGRTRSIDSVFVCIARRNSVGSEEIWRIACIRALIADGSSPPNCAARYLRRLRWIALVAAFPAFFSFVILMQIALPPKLQCGLPGFVDLELGRVPPSSSSDETNNDQNSPE
jgi:hypothetical protein